MRLLLLTFALVLLSQGLVLADALQPSSPKDHLYGKELMQFCSGRTDIDYGYCAGYIAAVSEIMMDHTLYGYNACGHNPVQDQQMVNIVGDFFNRNMERQTLPASLLVSEAISSQFSCAGVFARN